MSLFNCNILRLLGFTGKRDNGLNGLTLNIHNTFGRAPIHLERKRFVQSHMRHVRRLIGHRLASQPVPVDKIRISIQNGSISDAQGGDIVKKMRTLGWIGL